MAEAELQLTESEKKLILNKRKEEAEQAARVAFHKKAIATANDFMNWSEESGDGLTFSTFVNSFNYQDPDGKVMYRAVERILDAAWPDA